MKYNSKTLDELCDVKIGRTPPRNQSEWFNSGAGDDWKWVSIKDMGNCGKFITTTSETITDKAKVTFNYATVASGTILLSFKLTLGRVVICDGEFVTNEAIAQLPIKDPSLIDRDYLYYYLKNYNWSNIGSTSSIATAVNSKMVKGIKIDFPDLETQKKIARILSALDQKIELNNQQNNTLFDSVRAIFRNKYYQKGNDCSLSDYILTEINGDWGQDEKEENTEKAYCIRGADIPDMEYGNKGNAPSRYILEKRLEKKSLSEDDIIIEISGGSPTQSTGRTAYITQKILDMYDAPLLCTNFCKAIKVKNKIFAPFIYMYLKLLYEDGVLFNWENGTTGIKNLALSSLLPNTKVQSLNDKEARRFYDQFYAIANRISKNSAENMILIQMRDTLLPKLMSGGINLDGVTI